MCFEILQNIPLLWRLIKYLRQSLAVCLYPVAGGGGRGVAWAEVPVVPHTPARPTWEWRQQQGRPRHQRYTTQGLSEMCHYLCVAGNGSKSFHWFSMCQFLEKYRCTTLHIIHDKNRFELSRCKRWLLTLEPIITHTNVHVLHNGSDSWKVK